MFYMLPIEASSPPQVVTGQYASGPLGQLPPFQIVIPGAPKITGISPAQDPVGDTYSVTISGTGFGASPSENDSVSAGDGIIATIHPSSTNTSIKAYFLIQTSAPGGNHSVTVSAGGQSSNGVNFFVQIPTSVADYS